MKNLKLTWVILLGLGISLGSCKPDAADNPGQNTERPANFDEIKASGTFDWETSKSIQVSLNGYSSAYSDEQGVIILSDENGNVIYKAMHKTASNLQITLRVPASLSTLRVQFGITDKMLPINSNTVSGDLLPELPEVL